MGLFAELNRRNVFRVGVAYLVLGWVVIQVTDIAVPALRLPEWVPSLVFFFGLIGFPFALFFAWAFELTPEGIKLEKDVDRSQSVTHSTGRKIDFVIIGLLIAALAFVVLDSYVLQGAPDSEPVAADAKASPAASQATDATETSPGYDSIAVLPFDNMSNDPEQEYFSDGLAEELLNALAHVGSLKVAARNSSFAFKGQHPDIRDVGETLDVATVLEGSVRKSGKRLRITAQLIDVDSGYHLWSETYDRELTDIFAVQDELTAAIVSALHVHLATGEEEIASVGTRNWEAYDTYLKGLHGIRQRTEESINEALGHFESAVSMDPDYAAALALQAQAVMLSAQTAYGSLPDNEAYARGEALLNQALVLDSKLADAHAAKGYLLFVRGESKAALRSLDQAIALNPGLADAMHWRTLCLTKMGRLREALASEMRAYRLDPLHASVFTVLGDLENDYGLSVKLDLETAGQHHPGRLLGYQLGSLLAQNRLADAYRKAEENPGIMLAPIWQYFIAAALGREDEAAFARIDASFAPDARMQALLLGGQLKAAEQLLISLAEHTFAWYTEDEYRAVIEFRSGHMKIAVVMFQRLLADKSRPGALRSDADLYSNASVAMLLAYALQQTGDEAAAEPLLAQIRERIATLKKEGAARGYQMLEAQLHIIEGNWSAALERLEEAREAGLLFRGWFSDPMARELAAEADAAALKERFDAHLNAERAKLDWPATDF